MRSCAIRSSIQITRSAARVESLHPGWRPGCGRYETSSFANDKSFRIVTLRWYTPLVPQGRGPVNLCPLEWVGAVSAMYAPTYLISVTFLVQMMVLAVWPWLTILADPLPVARPAWNLPAGALSTKCHGSGFPLQACFFQVPAAAVLPWLIRTVRKIRSPRLQTGAGPLTRTLWPWAISVPVGLNAPVETAPANRPSTLRRSVNRKNGVGTGAPWQADPSVLKGFAVQFEEIGSRTSATDVGASGMFDSSSTNG